MKNRDKMLKINLIHLFNLDPYYYNLIVTDICMPGFNRFQFYTHIKVLDTDTKVLFLSAFDVATEIMIASPGLNAGDIIITPIDLDSFISKIQSMLLS